MTARLNSLAVICSAVAGLFLLTALIAVVSVSFTPKRLLAFPEVTWSLRQHHTLLDPSQLRNATTLSLQIALCAALLATSLAFLSSLGIWMMRPRCSGALIGLALFAHGDATCCVCAQLYFFLVSAGQVNDLIGFDSWPGFVLAHTVMIVPIAAVMISVSLAQVDRRIDLAARAMGAGILMRKFGVLLPCITLGVFTAFFLTFVLS